MIIELRSGRAEIPIIATRSQRAVGRPLSLSNASAEAHAYDDVERESCSMPIQFVLLPLFVQVALTFALMLGMMYQRTGALLRGETRDADIALREPNWPKRASQFAYAFGNQFELPVLFYVLTILAIVTRHADILFVMMAWIFVVFRVLQALVHVTSNNVRQRGAFYGVAAIVLVLMWIIFAVRILLGLP